MFESVLKKYFINYFVEIMVKALDEGHGELKPDPKKTLDSVSPIILMKKLEYS